VTVAWVVGSTGLLGSALRRELCRWGTPLFSAPQRLSWSHAAELEQQLAASVCSYAKVAASDSPWEIYWAAGVGTMGSAASDLEPETQALAVLLQLVESNPTLASLPGAVAFASTAGAIYAGAQAEIIDESTPAGPTTAYARAKLAQEALVQAFAERNANASALLARISTIYGPGQSAGKQQGLLAHMARCVVRNKPVQIFVPFDTIRDYICVDDAASAIVTALRAGAGQHRILTKIIASEVPTTIAEIVSIYKRLARRAPRIVTSANRLSTLYARRVQFRSIRMPDRASSRRTTLAVGIAQLLDAELAAYSRAA